MWPPRAPESREAGGPIPLQRARLSAALVFGVWGLCDSLASPSTRAPTWQETKVLWPHFVPFPSGQKPRRLSRGQWVLSPRPISWVATCVWSLLRGSRWWPLWFSRLSKSSHPRAPLCADLALQEAAPISELLPTAPGPNLGDRTSRSSQPAPSLPPARPGPSDGPWSFQGPTSARRDG